MTRFGRGTLGAIALIVAAFDCQAATAAIAVPQKLTVMPLPRPQQPDDALDLGASAPETMIQSSPTSSDPIESPSGTKPHAPASPHRAQRQSEQATWIAIQWSRVISLFSGPDLPARTILLALGIVIGAMLDRLVSMIGGKLRGPRPHSSKVQRTVEEWHDDKILQMYRKPAADHVSPPAEHSAPIEASQTTTIPLASEEEWYPAGVSDAEPEEEPAEIRQDLSFESAKPTGRGDAREAVPVAYDNVRAAVLARRVGELLGLDAGDIGELAASVRAIQDGPQGAKALFKAFWDLQVHKKATATWPSVEVHLQEFLAYCFGGQKLILIAPSYGAAFEPRDMDDTSKSTTTSRSMVVRLLVPGFRAAETRVSAIVEAT